LIRQAGPGDAFRIYAVMNGNLDDYFAQEVIEFFLAQWPTGQFIAEDIFGNTEGALCGSRLSNGRVSVSLLAVNASKRGRGIGTSLLDSFKRRCFMEGHSLIQLEVRVGNPKAIGFYRRNGFEVSEHLPGFYSDSTDAYRMVCRLSG